MARRKQASKRLNTQSNLISDEIHIPNYSGAEVSLSDKTSFCSLYLHEGSQTIALTKDAYTHLTGFTQGMCQNTTVTTDEIVIIRPGVYSVNWSLSAQSGTANQIIDIDLFVDGVEVDDGAARRQFGTANSIGNMGGTAILHLTQGNNVDLRAKNITSSADIIIFDMNLNVVQLTGNNL